MRSNGWAFQPLTSNIAFVEGLEWSRPSRARQENFQSILRERGVIATLRREKGHDIAAACGQLRLQTKKTERDVRLSV
jgi:23S rRNA (adenine2503-C2)-methyltransferase